MSYFIQIRSVVLCERIRTSNHTYTLIKSPIYNHWLDGGTWVVGLNNNSRVLNSYPGIYTTLIFFVYV